MFNRPADKPHKACVSVRSDVAHRKGRLSKRFSYAWRGEHSGELYHRLSRDFQELFTFASLKRP